MHLFLLFQRYRFKTKDSYVLAKQDVQHDVPWFCVILVKALFLLTRGFYLRVLVLPMPYICHSGICNPPYDVRNIYVSRFPQS